VLTPELGDAAIASCPCSRNFVTSFDPINPLPPITTIFIIVTFIQLTETDLLYPSSLDKTGHSIVL